MCGTDPGRPPSRRSTAVPRLMLVVVLTGKPVNSLIDPPPSSDRRSSSRSPRTFLKRVSSDSAAPVDAKAPYSSRFQVRVGIITIGHRGHGAIVANGRTCRHFLTNPSYFICRRAGVVGWHLERHRAHPLRARKSADQLTDPTPPEHQLRRRANGERRPDRQAGATASSAGRGRRACDTPKPPR